MYNRLCMCVQWMLVGMFGMCGSDNIMFGVYGILTTTCELLLSYISVAHYWTNSLA